MKRKPNVGLSVGYLLQGVALATLYSGGASAFEIPTSNSDLNIRWDNTVKYNAGWRTQSRNQTIADTWANQAGDYRFDKGEMVTNRVDVLSEFDIVYQKNSGFRVSAAGWYDAAYDRDVKGNPAYQSPAFTGLGLPSTAYPGNRLPNSVARWYTKSGEILDAFAFGRLDLGSSPLDVKVGRHTVYWGESLYTPIHGVSYSQGPVDFRKAQATPGSEAKELFLPLNQISASMQINDMISVAGQYFFEWAPYRIFEGSTYFTAADFLFQGGTTYLGIPFSGDRESGPFKKPENRGSWGVNAKFATEYGTIGTYYRKFDDKIPVVLSPGGTFSELFTAYAKDVEILGASYSKRFGGTAIGAELVHRKNTALATAAGSADIARGDTWHALVNTMTYFGKTGVFDSAVLTGEINYSRLDKLYGGSEGYYNAVGYVCAGATGGTGGWKDGCATRDAWGLNVGFTPTWFAVLPQTDLTMPVSLAWGLKGNSPVPFGGNRNSGSFSIGLGADYQAKYKLDLTYTQYFGDVTAAPNAFAGIPGIGPTQIGSSNGNGGLKDRGWVSLTLKTTF